MRTNPDPYHATGLRDTDRAIVISDPHRYKVSPAFQSPVSEGRVISG
ncbi:MAG TPA: hypothetical protein VMH81_17775 [Bryobacteraceae bacterium]|nr:hypothetical protein [Bryobacteraceae bacterium]